MKTKIMNLFRMMEKSLKMERSGEMGKSLKSLKSLMQIFATYATYASAIFVGKESNESTVRYALWSRISLTKPLQNPYLTLTRFRLSLGSNLSRFSLASLICLCMLTVGVGDVLGASWTLSYTDFNSDGYAYNDGDHTKDGISYNTSNVMRNGSNIQFKASSGTLYNKTAMPGNITKITAGGGVTIKVGAAQNPSSGTTVTSGSAISGSYKYFWIKKTNSGAATMSSITVEYAVPACTVSFNTGAGNPTVASRTEASGGAGITLPSTSDLTPACSGDGWELYGWTTSAYGSSSTTTAPTTTLAGLAGDTYYPSSNETLYAVYRKADGAPESTSVTYTINGNWTTDNGNWTKVDGNNLDGTLASGKYGLNSGSSTATSPVSYSEISGIQFTGSKSSKGAGSVEFLYGSGSSWTSLGSKSIANTLTWSVDPAVSGNLKIVFTRTNGNIYIASIKVTYTNASYFYWSNPTCCTPLGSVNGSISENNPTSVTLTWSAVSGAEKYQVKVPGSSSHNNWTDVNTTSVTVTKSCGTAYTAYFRAIDTNGSHCSEGPESTLAIPAVSWTVTSTGITHATASPTIPSTTCSGFSTTISPATGYALPADITVTNASKSWNSSTGALSISSVTGNVSITITPTCVSPVITADPADANYYVGDSPDALSVTATLASGTLTYLWKVSTNGGSTWSDAAGTNNAATYSGASLSTASAGTLKFKCIVGNSEGGCSVESGVATITVANASYFPNGKTLFFEAKTKEESAWKDNAQCKAWFRDCDSGCGEAPWTYWQTDGDSNKKYYAVVIPSTGDYPYVTIQRFSDYTGNTPWGEGGAQTYSTGGGSNVIKSTCASGECLSWSPTSMQIYLRGDITNDEWASNIGEMTDQNGGIWSYTYANYSSSGSTLAFKLYTNYNTWIGNTTDNSNAVLEGMRDGSTYNITATYNIVDHSLVMSKTFVKGTVHFNLQGHGSAISDLTNVTVGSKISAPSAPSASGWHFIGWYKEAGCTNAWNFASDVVSETMTLYAKWVQTFTVTYNSHGGSGTMTDSNSPYDSGSTVTVKSNTFTAPTGKEFDHWNTAADNSGASYAPAATFAISANTTLYAQWRDIDYTVTMAQSPAAGAELTGGTTSAHYGGTINISTNVPSGYRFTGWTASPSVTFADASATSTSFTMPAGNVTVTAHFQQTHTVTWKNNGENYGDPVVYDHGAALAFPAGTPSAPSSCSGKVFVGWTSDPEITSETSTEPTLITAGGAVNTDLIYRAVFADVTGSPISWTQVTSVSVGDEVVIAEIDDNTKELTGFNTTITTANNFGMGTTFTTTPAATMVWTVEAGNSASQFSFKNGDYYLNLASNNNYLNGSETKNANSSWTVTTSNSRAKITNASQTDRSIMYKTSGRFASYKKSHGDYEGGDGTYYYYVILYKKIGGVSYDNYITQCCSLKPVTGLAESGKTATSVTLSWTAPSPTTGIDHLELRNASTDAKIGSNIAVGTTTTTVSGLIECETYSYKIVSVGASCETSSEVVDAQPFSGAKTVTYNYHEGSGDPASFTTSCGNTTTTLPTPTRTNYRFDGWYTEASGGILKGGGGDSYTPDATVELHAQWTRVYTVTYAYAGGSGSCAGGSYAAGETVTTCATATKAGSTLTGWMRSDNSATVTKGNTFTMPASNVTLTAVWEDTPYTLTQDVGSHTTKGHAGTTITSGMTSPSGLDLTYTISDNSYALPKAVTISGGGQTWTLGTNYTWSLSEDKHSATLHIEADLTITADVTVTVTEKARYTVIWDEHGSTTTEYYAADDNTVTLKTGIADCGEKKFYGWTEDAEFVSNSTTPPTMASSGAISGNKHYYAIFGDKSGGDGFVLVTSIVAGEGYYMATGLTSSDKVYTGQNASNSYGSCTANNSTGSSFSGETLLSFPTAAKSLTVAISNGKFSLYDGTSYLGAANSNSLIFDGDPVYEWKLSTNKIQSQTYTSRYIKRNTSNERVCAYETTSGVADMYLYKPNISWTNFSKTCTLYDIEITTPSGGEVTTTPAAGTGVAGEGQTITVNVTPNSCKYLSALKYNDGSDHAISIASTPYTFTMPASDVTVTATFADKSVSSISANTATHRTLMQNTSFEGEQIRVTYNNGETEDLAWNASGLTFSGYNMSTLGNQTVSVAYVGSCGSANTSYDIEVTDGIPVTFSDCGITETIKYDPDALVNLDSKNGAYACSGWEFVGWSESSVAANSTSFTPVRNFNASTARTLYAVYAHQRVNGSSVEEYESADMVADLKEGARYVLATYVHSSHHEYGYTALLPTVTDTYYLNGTHSGSDGFAMSEDRNAANSYVYHTTTTFAANAHWQLMADGSGYWQLYNKTAGKYLDLSGHVNGYVGVSTTPSGKIVISNVNESVGDNNSQLNAKHSTCDNSVRLNWDRGSSRFNQYAAQSMRFITKDEYFSSTPPCAPRSATFHGNGGTVIASGGSPTGGDLTIREATRDAGITTPTAEYEDCDGKSWSFIGWADHEVDVTRVPVLTTDLLNDGGGNKPHAITTDDEEFWAVYTNQGEPMTQYGTISFSMSDIRLDYHTDETEVTKTVPAMGDYTFGYKRVGHQSNTGIQFESTTGEFYNKTSLGRVNAISFNTFVVGGVNNLKVYVGDAEKATTYELTAAELQVVGTTYTYYPSHNCEYVYIKNYNSYVCVEGISIEFGKGTKVWATTPDCKRVTLSGDIYATSINGRGIMAVTPLRVNAYQLDPSAGIVISSNSSDVYFSTDRNANFAKAAANQPKTSVTVNAGLDGNLSTDIYVHYKPSSVGDGIPADVMVSANLAIPDPGVTASHPIHVRNLPEKFVIAAKVGATWYALPADMNAETNPSGVVIEVDETNMTATAPNTCSYTIWPVKTTNGEYDRYAINTAHYDGNAFGERVRFSAINNGNKGLWANNATSGNGIRNYAAITSTSDGGTTENTNPSYEWKITATVADGQWQYTLQTDQTQNNRYLRYWSAAAGGPKWGTYASGEQNLYFLPVTEVEPFEMQVVEWYPTKVLIQTDAALASPTVKVNSESVASPVLTNKGGKLWEISGLPLESNPTKSMTVAFTADEKNYACTKTVPIIISREAKTQASEPFATLGAAIYTKSDVVVRDGAVLTVNGSNAANTFNDVTIYPTSKISVPSDKKLTVHALTFFGGIDEIYDGSAYSINKYGVPELSLKGTLHKSIAQIDYVMRVDDSQMYSLTVPYEVNLADITYWDGTSMGTLGDKLWVSAYDGAARANKDMSHTWIWEANFASKGLEEKLKAGVGYTISADLQAGVGSTYSILRMPMVNNVANDGTELAKTVRVEAYGRESAVSDNHKGWNLVGNPYMVSISGGDADSKLVVGYLQETGTGPWEWVDDEYRYVTIPADNGQDYWQEKFSSATLKPFKNFFLQIATSGDLSFALASRQDAPARYLEAQKREVEFEINLANGSHEDHTGLLIAEEYSPAYEINADLEKMENAMAVYTLTGGYKLAYNALSPDDAEQLIPVGYVANIAGTYTFDLDETSDVSEVEHIWLTDYELSRVVDLIDGVYEFTTSNGRNESRFALSVELKDEQQTPTGILNAKANDGRALKFIWQDKMYIMRNGVIYDATGKKVR